MFIMHVAAPTHVARGWKTLQMYDLPITVGDITLILRYE